MNNKGLDLKLDTIENNVTGVLTFMSPPPGERRFIGMFDSLDQLKSYSSKYTVGDFAAIAREVKNEGLPTTVEYDEYVYTGPEYGWVRYAINVTSISEIVDASNHVQEVHNTNPSGWGYGEQQPKTEKTTVLFEVVSVKGDVETVLDYKLLEDATVSTMEDTAYEALNKLGVSKDKQELLFPNIALEPSMLFGNKRSIFATVSKVANKTTDMLWFRVTTFNNNKQ